jgi:hypothetical protein
LWYGMRKGDAMFEVKATFRDEGECRLKVNGEERALWQVQRMALEELLFRGISAGAQRPTKHS